tara:strand:- start:1439 stop:2455 length:1017 start_codon:yes stop_codon:yes gene_type:complete
MSDIDPARIRSVLASEGLTASYGDPKLDVPDGRAEVDGLYKKLQRFQKDHRSNLSPKGKKALNDALDSLVNLNAHLASLSASLYDNRWRDGKTASRLPISKDEIALVEQNGWPDMMTRAEVSDWAMNSIRDDWRESRYPRWRASREEHDPENPDLNLPSRSVLKRFLTEEFNRIRQKGLDYNGYLRVSRAGSEFLLNRLVRRMVYLHYLAKTKDVKSETWTRRYAGKTASDVGQTILRQMGGARRLSMMIGAKNFVVYKAEADSEYGEGMGAAAFKFPRPGRGKPNYVKIVLNGRDYYDVKFGSIHGYKFKPMKEYTDISASGLQSLFERETGLYLTF